MEKIYLNEDSRIYLRPINDDDTSNIVKWRNQDNVKRYFFYREEFTVETHEKWMREKIDTGLVIQFIVCMKEDDRPVGSTYLRDIDMENKSAEYGVFMGDESIRGHGIGKEALNLTLEYAWKEMGLKRVIARAIATNKPSIYSFINSGFEIYEEIKDVLCSDGEKVDMVMMCITH